MSSFLKRLVPPDKPLNDISFVFNLRISMYYFPVSAPLLYRERHLLTGVSSSISSAIIFEKFFRIRLQLTGE
jgi:hypothetical protein